MAEVNREAFIELQTRLVETDRKLKQVANQIRQQELEKKRATLTLQELSTLPDGTNTYRAVGRCFIMEELGAMRVDREEKISDCSRNIQSLQTSMEYLERQMKEVQSNFKELVENSPAIVQQMVGVSSKAQ